MPLFTLNDLKSSFRAWDIEKGEGVREEGRVLEVHEASDGRRIKGRVQGTQAAPYKVDIRVLPQNPKGGYYLHATCSCPVGFRCKHGAAVALDLLARQAANQAGQAESFAHQKNILQRWVAALALRQAPAPSAPEAASEGTLAWILDVRDRRGLDRLSLAAAVIRRLESGRWAKPSTQPFYLLANMARAGHLALADVAVLSLLRLSDGLPFGGDWEPPEDPGVFDLLLQRVLATGHAFLAGDLDHPLRAGPPLEARADWDLLPDGRQQPRLGLPRPGLVALRGPRFWYLDPLSREVGPLDTSLSMGALRVFLEGPSVGPESAEWLRSQIPSTTSALPRPRAVETSATPLAPRPVLRVRRASGGDAAVFDEAEAALAFDYGGARLDPDNASPTVARIEGDRVVVHPRDREAEKAWIARLRTEESLELAPAASGEGREGGLRIRPVAGQDSPWFWTDFGERAAPTLREAGALVEMDPEWTGAIVHPDGDGLEATLSERGDWWFSLELGITVEGRKLALLPLLVALLRRLRGPEDVARLTARPNCYVPLPDGRKVALPSDRVRVILQTLVELFGDRPLDSEGRLNVPLDLASAFLAIEAATHARWVGPSKRRQLVEKLGHFEGLESQPLPKGLKATLRGYQKQGYDWLHFLGQNGLGGVLADDMGLGKTVQALAWLLARKETGVAGKPSLIVMPTSLIANWQAESARFAPALRTVTLHGKARAALFNAADKADLVFTTYPLLVRDREKLLERKWDAVVLDEAQAIKNPAAKATQTACALKAEQRLCLTGTPVENHLGEAWSLFAFLMPGLLGDHKSFTKLYRNPIEKGGDAGRRESLARRLRPFILRRLKADVVKELPPKTETIWRVPLADDQRDLYETVRHAMNDKVREVVADKGFNRSRIIILDALLKLRQVCCDPRLVKLDAARKVASSAKLAALMEMLPTLIEDGRRVLLFSQFTSMMDLIRPELDSAGIAYVELRGTTKDRRTPVARFQNGEVPLFLISLKAGGTGLNLTAADTVIHYDPWWNPSVENQATDRAHRIGQDKPVFVYKLIAEGTVEERILDLQTRKAKLAGALFGEDPAAAAALTSKDLEWLLGEG